MKAFEFAWKPEIRELYTRIYALNDSIYKHFLFSFIWNNLIADIN